MHASDLPVLNAGDDGPAHQECTQLLRAQGFEVVHLSSAEEAVQKLSEIPEAVLLVHEFDDGAGGSQLCRNVREQWPNTPIVGIGLTSGEGDADLHLPQADLPSLLGSLRLLSRLRHGAPQKLRTLAHDMRNALAPMRSAIAILGRAGHDERMRAPAVAMLEKQIPQLLTLIDALSSHAHEHVPSPAPQAAVGGRSALRVLVADDSEAVQDSVGALLRSKGHEVRSASNGLEALDTAETWRPDVVFVDMRMPELDGFGLVRRLRASYPSSAMRIVLMSGLSLDAVLLKHAKAAGFDECIDKAGPPEQWFAQLH